MLATSAYTKGGAKPCFLFFPMVKNFFFGQIASLNMPLPGWFGVFKDLWVWMIELRPW